MLFDSDLDALGHSVVRKCNNGAAALALGGDLAALSDCGDRVVGCHVAQFACVTLRHQLLVLLDLVDLGLDLEGLARLQSDLGLVHAHAPGVGVSLDAVVCVSMHHRAGLDIGLFAVFHDISFDIGLA